MPSTKLHFWKVVAFAFFLPAIFAMLDLYGAYMWGLVGGWDGEAYLAITKQYQTLFWTFASVVIISISLTYYLITKDKSEALALLIIPHILLQFGCEDVLFYLFGGFQLWTDTMPWLTNNLWPPTILANLFGHAVITGPVLLLSATLGVFTAVWTAKRLVKING
jgi:ABC-type phosphate transport system permease subunit